MMMALPIIGTQLVPGKIRLIFSLALTYIIVCADQTHLVLPSNTSFFSLFLIVVLQAIIGILMGLVIQIIFQTFMMAGQIISMQMGLGFASLMDPQNGISVPIVGQLYIMIATLLYLTMNGHLFVIGILVDSFAQIPVNQLDFDVLQIEKFIALGSFMFSYGLKIALPAVITILITNISFGMMTKAAPQLNIFTLGFSITLIAGFALIYICLSFMSAQFTEVSEMAHTTLVALIE
ncbi:flagellar biosynthetic protein FliR [Candidatus Berkiella aquae]|uniref:Flagellar biosynthetic protein FliR n=2 Tax=Candidatus Berkiella aquae TaxID=295108 RepID=A0A0Q9YZ42_9GAMM|nr:flagellar biosynthetic protein FliR [Candidatus Berkiella aquae]